MPGITGREVQVAFAKFGANSWGVAASVTNGIYFQSDGGLKFEPNIVEDDAFGQTFIRQSDVGNIVPPDLSLPKQARYDDYGYIWEALAMGSPTAVTISTSAAGEETSWSHVFDLAANIDGLGLTLAIDKSRYVQELTSGKVYGWDFEDDGAVMRQTFKVMGSKPTIISSINVSGTVSGATYPDLANRILKQQGVFRMNANADGALGASDAVDAEAIKFGFLRPLDGPHVYGQDYIIEPAGNGFPTFSVEVTYPRMTTIAANSLEHGLRDNTAFKADWTFTSANFINSTDKHSALYEWPYLQLTSFEALTASADQIKPKAVFAARLAPTSPTGMAFVNPFRLTRIMQQSLVAF